MGRGYPRPQLRRAGWQSLDGEWDFALDPTGAWRAPADVVWGTKIVVPFAPEAPASTIDENGFFDACWYRRSIPTPDLPENHRLLLHFGAVDYEAIVWCNDLLAGRHQGGYTPFTIDLTPFAAGKSEQIIVVRAADDPHDLAKPRGKQDWQ